VENNKNSVSATAETEKQPQNGSPTPGNKKTLKITFSTLWKQKKHLKAALQPLGKQKD
jgi:hypothetical protein